MWIRRLRPHWVYCPSSRSNTGRFQYVECIDLSMLPGRTATINRCTPHTDGDLFLHPSSDGGVNRKDNMATNALEFDKPIAQIESKIEELKRISLIEGVDRSVEISGLERDVERLLEQI